MNRHTFIRLIAALCALSALASACVDHAYDFDRTESSITLGGDELTFPLGSTGRVQIGDLVAERFGNLFARQDDGTFSAHYTADPVDFIFAGLKDYDGARPFRKYCNVPMSTSFSLFRVPRSGVRFDEQDEADLSDLLPGTIRLPNRSKGASLSIPRMPEQLLGLEAITLTDASRVKVTFSIPDCLLTGGTVTPQVNVDLSQFFENEDATDGIVRVSVDLNKANNFTSTVEIPLRKLVLDPESFDAKSHTLTMDARIGFSGSVTVTAPRTTRARYQSVGESNLLQVTAELLDLTCESIEGRYDYQITQMQTRVDLSDLTGEVFDRIGDKDAVFDFDNPEIILDVESNISVPTYALVKLTAWKKKTRVAVRDSIVVPFPVAAPGETVRGNIRLAKTAASPQDVVLDFTDLVRIAPDQIVVDINGYTCHDKSGEVRVGQVYQAHVTPRVNIPLAFGPVMQLTLRDTLSLPADLSSLLQDNSLTLLGEITNTLPLQLGLDLLMTDEAGNVLLEPVCETISGGGTGSISVPMARLSGSQPGTLSKALLTFKLSGTQDNRPVRADDYVQAVLRLRIPGGYHLNFNDPAQ